MKIFRVHSVRIAPRPRTASGDRQHKYERERNSKTRMNGEGSAGTTMNPPSRERRTDGMRRLFGEMKAMHTLASVRVDASNGGR